MTLETVSDVCTALSNAWREAGVKSGEALIVHSSSVRLLYACKSRNRAFTPGDVIESFLSALGPDGTLLMPLFNFKVINERVFDIRTTPSAMGAITEAARQHPAALRTEHPFLSFAAIGRHAKEFAALRDYTGIGPSSPFALVHQLNGRVAALDLYDNQCMSFYHHVEQAMDVKYRFIKDVEVAYTDHDGATSSRMFGYYARDWDNNIITDVTNAGEALWRQGFYQGEIPGKGYGFRTISAKDIFDYTEGVIRSGHAEGTLYTVDRSVS
ncbi:MAG: AAC(3) family N-acetyltransferase [Rhodospirillales bacterium]